MTGEVQLNNLIEDVLLNGVEVDDPRTGEKTLALFDSKIVIKEGDFPFFTNTLAHPRLAFEEMWFFLRGETQTKELEKKGVNFWKGNTSRESLNRVGLSYLDEGELGSAYSNQWRHSGGYDSYLAELFGTSEVENDFAGKDQLESLLYGLRENKYGRRHVINLWNPNENVYGCITPCWLQSIYVVLPDKDGNDTLHLKLHNRSLDTLFGARYALMQYRMFQMVLCRMFGFKLGKLSADLTQYHLYDNQIEYAKELLSRDFVKADNSLKLKEGVVIETMSDLITLSWEDWEMSYTYNKEKFITPRPEMVA